MSDEQQIVAEVMQSAYTLRRIAVAFSSYAGRGGAPRAGLEALRAKYEPYREEAPPGPLLALRPERYLWWRAADRPAPDGRSGDRGG